MRFLYFLTETPTWIFSLYSNFVAIFLLKRLAGADCVPRPNLPEMLALYTPNLLAVG